jgi:hypothetical protein
MKVLYLAALLGTMAATVLVSSAVAQQSRKIVFKGSYAGTAVTKVTGDRIDYNAKGTGSATLVKSSKISGIGVGDKSTPPCAPFNGPGAITSKIGKLKLNVLKSSRACAANEQDQDHVTFSGTAKVLGGTMKLNRARGSLHFSGKLTRSTGHFTITLRSIGSLTY